MGSIRSGRVKGQSERQPVDCENLATGTWQREPGNENLATNLVAGLADHNSRLALAAIVIDIAKAGAEAKRQTTERATEPLPPSDG